MATPRRYVHDRLVLLLLTVNTFFAILISILISFSLNSGAKRVFIIEHRQHIGEISANTIGTPLQESSFIVFVFMVLLFHTILSRRVYHIRRNFSIAILGMGTLLILLAGIVSYYLLQQ